MTKWQEIRRQVLERDNYVCRECGQSLKWLDVHHKIPRRKGGLDVLDNLIALCKKCHKSIEPCFHVMSNTVITMSKTTIQLEEKTRDRLRSFGIKGESYDDIVIRLMNMAEGKK